MSRFREVADERYEYYRSMGYDPDISKEEAINDGLEASRILCDNVHSDMAYARRYRLKAIEEEPREFLRRSL